MNKQTILCVDDEIDNVDALERLFRKKYHVLKATSAREALSILDQHPEPISVIISDQRMPEMTGVEFLEKTIENHPETMRMLLTGYTDLESVIMAVNKGQIFRYLTKPWDPVDLANTLDQAADRFRVGLELKLRNEELAAAYKELKSIDTAKSNFMILINHELKTPLTSILSFSSLLAESKLAEEDLLMVNRIQKAGEKLKSLVDDALLIVRAEMGQLKIDLQGLILNKIEDLYTPDIQTLLNKKNLSIKTQIESYAIQVDIRLLKQVLQRILHNAAKFANDGSEIQLLATRKNTHLHFQVINQGQKINPKTMEKIMRPFFIDEDVMHHSTGTGLGLTVCQAILKSHQSQLEVENHETGVTVSFELPIMM